MSTDFRPSKQPKIKPSHKGLLHNHLGIPQGERIGAARIEKAEHSSNPTIRKEADFAAAFNDHGTHGYITSIRKHHRGKHVELEIAHGHRSPKPKGKGKSDMGLVSSSYDDRPRSSILIKNSQAHQFHIGQHAGVGAIPLEGPDTDEMDEGEDVGGPGGYDDGDEDQYSANDALDNLKRSIVRGNGKSKRRAS